MIDHEQPDAARIKLARLGEQAAENVERLREGLKSLRELQPERDVDSVTERVALQQELDTLRQTLSEKERLVDVTAAQCRRLEDELEDQHLAYDGLKQDLERKKLSLAAAREQVARLSKERQEIEERYQALLVAGAAPARATVGGLDRLEVPRFRFALPAAVADRRVLAGLGAGLVLAVFAGLALNPGFRAFFSDPEPASQSSPAAREAGESFSLPDEPEASVVPDTVSADESDQTFGENVLPVVTGRVTDRLRNGGTGPLMLALQAGRFTMGKMRALPGDDQGPSREVDVDAYLIAATETTFDEYDRFARATGRRLPSDFGWGRGSRPVVDVSWDDARAYAAWLSRQTGRTYRLPSEAEWEYAASAGRRSIFWWGGEPGTGRAVCFDCGTRWDNVSTATVGTFEPNPLGLYDTAGNAMEWVQDCYHPSYTGAPLDARSWEEGNCRFRVARGGSFNKPSRSMRSTARHHFDPRTRLNMLGFRLARDR